MSCYTMGIDIGSTTSKGVILKDGSETDELTFTNKVSETSLTVSKVQTGGNAGEQFTFRIDLKLNGEALEGSYHFTGSSEGEISSGDEFKLTDGESITIEGLPVGTAYTVSEVRNGTYITKISVDGGAEETGNTAEGTLEDEYGTSIVFHNTQATTGFQVTKRWNGDDKGRISLYVYVGIKADVLS